MEPENECSLRMPLLKMSVSPVWCQYSIEYSFDPVSEYLHSKFSCIRYLAMFVEKILYVLRAQCDFYALEWQQMVINPYLMLEGCSWFENFPQNCLFD